MYINFNMLLGPTIINLTGSKTFPKFQKILTLSNKKLKRIFFGHYYKLRTCHNFTRLQTASTVVFTQKFLLIFPFESQRLLRQDQFHYFSLIFFKQNKVPFFVMSFFCQWHPESLLQQHFWNERALQEVYSIKKPIKK